jgi:hypothetical protein
MLASCKKNIDVAPTAELPAKLKGDQEFKKCNITKIIEFNPYQPPAIFYFEYDSKGNPTKVTPSYFGTNYPVQLFRYDKKGRLTDYIGTDPWLTGFEFWHVYVYDNKNRIIRDTAHIWGRYGDVPHDDRLDLMFVNAFEYDSQERIIKSTLTFPLHPQIVAVQTYNYNNAGNLIEPGAVYDDKVNIHRTNSIWMFIDRNYSVNNSWPIPVYNNYGLPTVVGTDRFYGFLNAGMSPHYIEYDCKGHQEN